MEKALNTRICAECGEGLAIFFDLETKRKFLACKRWDRNGHTKIGKPNQEVNKYREESFFMAEQSLAVQSKLAKYQGLTTLNRDLSKEIIVTLWPEAEKASPAEVYKAMMLCVQYGLNPLMNHLFLLPFKEKETGKVTFVTVLGIKANRLIASRKHKYTFLDDTPRIMSGDEQMKVYGKIQDDKIIFITKIKDLETGAEAVGRGEWKKLDSWGKANTPKGTDKGNSMENMSATRSERQAYDRLYPADMPDNSIPVVDDAYETVATQRLTSDVIEGESRDVEPIPPATEAPPPPPATEGKAEIPPSVGKAPKPVRDLSKIVSIKIWLTP